MKKDQLPFLFGSQYYRAPTPEKECWAEDLAKMKDIGFNQVKYWVQWRWQHRAPDRFYWDDLDRLMDLAGNNGIGVTLNAILDVAPIWLYERYPDAKQIDIKGLVVEPFAVQHRQVGGQPGPCYNHAGALDERKKFLHAAVDHFRGHQAMQMWDVWNEPEQSYPRRHPDMNQLTCYCPSCRQKFSGWLRKKYGSLERLNDVWARCYEAWEQVEMPRTDACVTDFIDWREFHLDTMTSEAKWRLDMARKHDPASVSYLHVVPASMTIFNPVTCVDDFDIAEHSDVWAATMNQSPTFTTQVVSAARGKVAYNVESHVNYGSLRRHQRILRLPDLLADWLPQIGLGVKGFMYWQFRPEVAGTESPAWGVVNLDGSDRPATEATRTFWKTIEPHVQAIMNCPAPQGEVGIFKSRKNELYHFCMDKDLAPLASGVESYLHNLYWMNYRFRFVSGQMLERGDMPGIKLLILPSAIYLSQPEVDALNTWVRNGGVVLSEAHLASYNATIGRHARQMPGCGLSREWGIRETESTATQHLKLEQAGGLDGFMTADERKAWGEGVGGEYVPIRLTNGATAWGGGSRYALLESEDAETIGSFDGEHPTILLKRIGQGAVIYCGSNLGQGAKRDAAGLREVLKLAATRAGVTATLDANADTPDVHVDLLANNGSPKFVLMWNRSSSERTVNLMLNARLRGLFTGPSHHCTGQTSITLRAHSVDLFQVE
ncbi:MAG TPA: beta-galactosidase [Tepidisphaeraceae bacterium]|nr:beta-galactosidase [Tepidisphaeraceae bacterium]